MISGTPVTQVRDDIYLVDVVVRATDEQRVSLDNAAQHCRCRCRAGAPFRSASSRPSNTSRNIPLVWRRDRVPTLTVQADVGRACLPETVVAALAPAIEALRKRLPASYRIAVGGTVEESAKSQASVIAVVPVMLLIMFTVLMVQLQSFQRLFIVLSVAPARPDRRGRGAAAVRQAARLRRHSRHSRAARHDHQERGDPDRPDRCRARGRARMSGTPAIDASSARFRPIMLTAVSTVLGMIPIAPTVFWGPMAFAIMGGLLVATVLTLIFLPTLYVAGSARRTRPKTPYRPGRRGAKARSDREIPTFG